LGARGFSLAHTIGVLLFFLSLVGVANIAARGKKKTKKESFNCNWVGGIGFVL
jgi:hypothetical protein